ncbi:MAG: DoxX family protein [Acidobacteriota bacterium]
MAFDTQASTVSKQRLWTGRILSAIIVLFLLFDAVGKFMKPVQVMDACARLGWPSSLVTLLGVILLACTLLYAFPSTSILGATLLTGYLGGAVAIQLRSRAPLFESMFPIIFGLLIWVGLWLRDTRVALLIGRRT